MYVVVRNDFPKIHLFNSIIFRLANVKYRMDIEIHDQGQLAFSNEMKPLMPK